MRERETRGWGDRGTRRGGDRWDAVTTVKATRYGTGAVATASTEVKVEIQT